MPLALRAPVPAPLAGLVGLLVAACAPAAPPATCATSPAPPAPAASAPAVPPSPAPACAAMGADAARFFAQVDAPSGPFEHRGAYTSEHLQLFRVVPRLARAGFVRSIVRTTDAGAHGPIYAVTLIARAGDDGPFTDALLAFAAAPCAGGDLALLGAPIPLGAPDAVITYAERLPPVAAAALLTELRVELAEAPPLMGPRVITGERSYVVGAPRGEIRVAQPKDAAFGVIGVVPLRAPAPAAPGATARHDEALLGSGWFPLGGAAAFLLVHHVVPDDDGRCAKEKPALIAPELRLAARIDARGFTSEPARVGAAYVVAIPENQPSDAIYRDAEHRCVTGPLAPARHFKSAGASWLYGLFASGDEASARARALGYKTGKVYCTEPAGAPSGATCAFTLPAKPPDAAPSDPACDSY